MTMTTKTAKVAAALGAPAGVAEAISAAVSTYGIKNVPEVPTVDRRPEEDANTNAFQQFPTEPTIELATAPAVIEEKPELTREQIANMTSEQLRAYYMS